MLFVGFFLADKEFICIVGDLDLSSVGTCIACVFDSVTCISIVWSASQMLNSPSHVLATFRTHAIELYRVFAWLDQIQQCRRMCNNITLPYEPFLHHSFKGTTETGDECLINHHSLVPVLLASFDLGHVGICEQGIPDFDIISNALVYFPDGDGIV